MPSKNGDGKDYLEVIPFERWGELTSILRREENWPHAIYAYYHLRNCQKWKLIHPEFPITIYVPRGLRVDGTYVVYSIMGGKPNLNFFTLEEGATRLKEALIRTRLLPWSEGLLVCGIQGSHEDVLKYLVENTPARIDFELLSTYHWMSADDARSLEVKCPPECYLAPLKEHDVDMLNSIWPHSYPGSENHLRELITLNGGIGLFLKESGQICSWIMKNQFYGLGILQTLPQYQGRGYAKVVVKAMTRSMGEEDVDIHACIMRSNHTSLKLFKDLGFKFVDKQMWVQLKKDP